MSEEQVTVQTVWKAGRTQKGAHRLLQREQRTEEARPRIACTSKIVVARRTASKYYYCELHQLLQASSRTCVG